ncbi:MAG: pantoate--beta-alanine ligase [bacterium]
MEVYQKAREMRNAVLGARCADLSVGFVPTMGTLHEGHCQLIRRAARENDRVAISCYVNARQFDTQASAAAYPRELEKDLEVARSEKVDFVFTPSDDEMYPRGDCSTVLVNSPVTRCYEGAIRPNFFEGVARVVAKLFNIVPADRVYFGEKDLQQLIVIKQMVRDLHFLMDVIPVPVQRDDNGVAFSSRNKKFSEEDWQVACRVHQIMVEAKNDAPDISRQQLFDKHVPRLKEAGLDLQYLDVVRYPDYDPAWPADKSAVLIIAGYIGATRLKDNLPLHVDSVGELEND